MDLSTVPTLELLRAIIARGPLETAPAKTERFIPTWEVVVGIGDDHVAYVTIDDEAYDALIDSCESSSDMEVKK